MAELDSNVLRDHLDLCQSELDYIGCRVRAAIRKMPDEEQALEKWYKLLTCELVSSRLMPPHIS